jgi:hypothetical protein
MEEFPIYQVTYLATPAVPPVNLPDALATFLTAVYALQAALGGANLSAPTLEAALEECCARLTRAPLPTSNLIAEGVETELRWLGAAYELAKEQAHTSYQAAWETMADAWEKGGASA